MVDYPWIIYYANGDIYAARGKYYYNVNGEASITWEYSLNNSVKSEKEEVSVYNRKYNRYEKGSMLDVDRFSYVSKDKSNDISLLIEIPRVNKKWGSTIEQVDRIDKETLDD